MGKHGCNLDGSLNAASFAKPMPTMGFYIAGASLICFLYMSNDVITGFRSRSFHCRLFSLNSMTLTLLSVATKLTTDLSSHMPSHLDQLSKLNGTVFICTAMANFMPSLTTMNDSEIITKIVSLAIFIITVIVDMCIQMGTGVIYTFLPEHVIVMALMLLLLLLFCLSSFAVPATRHVLDRQYRVKLKYIDEPEKWRHDFEHLKAEMEKLCTIWFMQVVLRESLGVLQCVLLLWKATIKCFVLGSLSFCNGNSDYGWWSIGTILGSQALAVFVGSYAPLLSVGFGVLYSALRNFFLQILKGMKDQILNPFNLFLTKQGKDDDWARKLAFYLPVKYILTFLLNFRGTLLLPRITFMLRHYPPLVNSVLNEGERESVPANFQHGHKECERMINGGIENNPCLLIKLLKNRTNDYNSVGLFNGVLEFDNYLVPPITTSAYEIHAPPNCWTLPVVILTSIANSFGHSDKKRMKSLKNIVREGLRFTKFIEENLEDKSLISVRDAAEFLWAGMDYCTFFVDINLHKDLSSRGKFSMTSSPKGILKKLTNAGKVCVLRSKAKLMGVPHVLWLIEVIIGYNLYRHTISDLLAACLSNLPHALYTECVLTDIAEAEERVKRAAYVLGKSQEILQILHFMDSPDPDHIELAYIEKWRSVKQFKYPTSGSDLV
ncbi:hypothetical protein NE237_005828 [Protea cynaroides]|uniref:Uncharacterized protein n=1 Tax=Protea cynaroides TaxID=273540 RepID=A0A9Q0KLY5_9MAGN|nr:hypothetical protein NE237_005828 [Protea cynaroides]